MEARLRIWQRSATCTTPTFGKSPLPQSTQDCNGFPLLVTQAVARVQWWYWRKTKQTRTKHFLTYIYHTCYSSCLQLHKTRGIQFPLKYTSEDKLQRKRNTSIQRKPCYIKTREVHPTQHNRKRWQLWKHSLSPWMKYQENEDVRARGRVEASDECINVTFILYAAPLYWHNITPETTHTYN